MAAVNGLLEGLNLYHWIMIGGAGASFVFGYAILHSKVASNHRETKRAHEKIVEVDAKAIEAVAGLASLRLEMTRDFVDKDRMQRFEDKVAKNFENLDRKIDDIPGRIAQYLSRNAS